MTISHSIGGTVGAIITCPLEVIKVRLQSSEGSRLRDATSPFSTISQRYTTTPVNPPRTDSSRAVHRIFNSASQSRAESHRAGEWTSHVPPKPMPSFNHQTSTRRPPSCHLSVATYMDTTSGASTAVASEAKSTRPRAAASRSILIRCLVEISQTEGVRALFKGLIPTLLGVLPSRGIYFCAYHKGQVLFQDHFPAGSSGVYLCAAAFGSITASSITNPIWFIKTRLQLDSRPGLPPITVGQVVRNTWRLEGAGGFYRGVSASYVGSLETALNFVIYENVKARLLWWQRSRQRPKASPSNSPQTSSSSSSSSLAQSTSGTFTHSDNTTTVADSVTNSSDLRGSRGGSKLNASSDMVLCMAASAFSKAVAITVLYPHEVVRTRLRESGGHYRGFLSTLTRVSREEGTAALYRGMGTHYIRQVPNSCIMIGTYEVVVFLLQSWGMTRLD